MIHFLLLLMYKSNKYSSDKEHTAQFVKVVTFSIFTVNKREKFNFYVNFLCIKEKCVTFSNTV